MGVDFNIRLIKKKESGVLESVRVDGVPHFLLRDHHYWPLFRDNRKKIEMFANQRLDLEFYEKRDGTAYGDETNKNKIFDPEKVKSTILLILKIIKEHSEEFPFHYWVGFKGNQYVSGGEEVFIDDKKTWIDGTWDDCYYMLDGKKIDLKKEKKEFSAHRVIHEKIGDVWTDKKGEKVIIVIKKDSLYDFYKTTLNDILVICDYALKHNYFIQGYQG